MEPRYKLRYLRRAQLDLIEIVQYISEELVAPEAASKLVDKIDKAILTLEQFPFAGHVYYSNPKLNDEHRMLIVDQYLIFYVILNDIVEIRRVIYGKRDYKKLFTNR
ncbi:plasmid stabilization protein [Paenibacillus sp. KS1]|uniref:type II toxin-antitoxin system RelE/ParE family toxin n=1 Tax=Paenibacillus sp. KS1 TaxID=1849249 RepID=UPI000806688E|nr:type II toxin-antitoxin system RelE/ParE family toxin [Paenibacillus sp. KS1]OBY78605.1 plasmid stabilization protein [Paenibacillus sp. KS1]